MADERSHGIATSQKQVVHSVNSSLIEQADGLIINSMPNKVPYLQLNKDAIRTTVEKATKDKMEKAKFAKKQFTKQQLEEEKKGELKKWQTVRKKEEVEGTSSIRKELAKKSIFSSDNKKSVGIKKDTSVFKQTQEANSKGIRVGTTKNVAKNLMKDYVKSKRIMEVVASGNMGDMAQEVGATGARALINGIAKLFRMAIRAAMNFLKMLLAPVLPYLLVLVPITVVLCLFINTEERDLAFRRVKKQAEIMYGETTFPEQVEQWRDFVVERCEANNDPNSDIDLTLFVNAILATIQQESGGSVAGGDIMQCAESGYSKKGLPSTWTNEQVSIDVGVRVFYDCLKGWGVSDPTDFEGLKMVAQGYNFGYAGFFAWARENGYTKWSLEMSQKYANKMAAQKGWSSYGHAAYGEEWTTKLQSANVAIMINSPYEYHAYVQGNYTRQTEADCPVTALADACRSLGCNVDPNDLEAHNYNPYENEYKVGLYRQDWGCEAWLNRTYPITVEYSPDMSSACINKALANGSLVIVYLHNDYRGSSQWKNGKNVSHSGSHWICLIGYSPDGKYVCAIDPADGVGDSNYCKPENCEGGVGEKQISMKEIQESVNDMYIITPKNPKKKLKGGIQ